MTVTRQAEFNLPIEPEQVIAATRAMLRSHSGFGSAEEKPNGLAFVMTQGQEVRIGMSVEPRQRGSRVELTLTSPPYVRGDVFGGYGHILSQLEGDIVAASQSGIRDDAPFVGNAEPSDDRSPTELILGLPPKVLPPPENANRNPRFSALRVVLVSLIVGGIVLGPWLVTHPAGLAIWVAVGAIAGAADWTAARRNRQSRDQRRS